MCYESSQRLETLVTKVHGIALFYEEEKNEGWNKKERKFYSSSALLLTVGNDHANEIANTVHKLVQRIYHTKRIIQ